MLRLSASSEKSSLSKIGLFFRGFRVGWMRSRGSEKEERMGRWSLRDRESVIVQVVQ